MPLTWFDPIRYRQSICPRALVCFALACFLSTSQPLAAAGPKWTRTAGSGSWSNATTWEGGQIPGAGARVHVQAGHKVLYDLKSESTLRAVVVAGRLSFATDRDTQMNVGVLKVEAGEDPSEEGFDCSQHFDEPDPKVARPALEVGTAQYPISAGHTALIRLVAVEGQDKQSCPAIVCCAGRMDFHGASMNRTWLKLGATSNIGDSTVLVEEAVTGWRVGDLVLITATKLGRDHGSGTDDDYQTEQRRITAIEGPKITFDKPLIRQHLGTGEFRGEVANLSRNVIVESADPTGERGHTMYHKGSAGSISYAEFRHLGKKNVLGRYALHYHLAGNTMRGSSIVGASIWDSHNRWLTIHGTNYLIVRDCVGFRSVGHGFFMEDGTEVLNTLDRNLAVQSVAGRKLPKQVLPFDQNEGSGFWWSNCLNTFTRNVSCENERYGFRFEATETSALKLTLPVQQSDGTLQPTDIRTLPFVRFENNEAHCDGLYGINLGEGVNRIGPDAQHPLVVKNTKIWEIHYAFRPQSPSLLVENLQIHKSIYGVYHPNFDRHVYRNVTISQAGRNGDAEPFNRAHDDDATQYGLLTVDGLKFVGHSNSGMPLIQISDQNPTGKAESHFRNVSVVERQDREKRALVNLGGGPRPNPNYPTSVPIYLHDYYGSGRHAKVVSARSGELKGSDAAQFRNEVPLTGDESRVAEVRDVKFPELLSPIDDLPPASVITGVWKTAEGWRVTGESADNGEVREVLVNGQRAASRRDHYAEWEVTLKLPPTGGRILATATDTANNVERVSHAVEVE